ncbi:hypothetical protein ACJ41O_005869 [Fusarium nematophilum]
MHGSSDNAKMTTTTLDDLLSSYSILSSLASWLSTLDLYHLALTSRSSFSYILESRNVFQVLRRQCLCDGRGLAKRQVFRSPYRTEHDAGKWTINPSFTADEEIEVRLYNVKCDEAGALPCVKCGINICEECRFYRRAAPPASYPDRRPHLTSSHELFNIMCLCPTCDAATEEQVVGKFLNELCDCDMYTRWICTRCKKEEMAYSRAYFYKHTKMEWDWDGPLDEDDPLDSAPSKTITDHVFERAVWLPPY